MENKAPKNDKQTKKRSKAAKIVLFSILGCIGVMVIVILVITAIGMFGGTGTQDGSILGLGFGTLFTVLGFLVLALILAWLLTEPSFKKEEEVIIDNDRNSYVKKAKTPRPLADKTGVKSEEKPEEKVEEKTEEKTEEKAVETAEKEPAAEEKVEKAEEEESSPEEAPAEKAPDDKGEDQKKNITPASEPEGKLDEKTADREGQAPVAAAAAVAAVAASAETVFVRYRRSYMSRLIQSDEDVKAYYTDIKNKLLSYKGVRDRISWDFESFNAGRKKLAKINVKGKTITVNLALDPKTVEAKYYAGDTSGKPKLSDVPTLMKVKSGRSVKYTLELIEKMMENEGIPANAKPSKETFDIAYRDTDALVKEGYIKAMYDKDVDPDGNYIEKEIDIEDFLKK